MNDHLNASRHERVEDIGDVLDIPSNSVRGREMDFVNLCLFNVPQETTTSRTVSKTTCGFFWCYGRRLARANNVPRSSNAKKKTSV